MADKKIALLVCLSIFVSTLCTSGAGETPRPTKANPEQTAKAYKTALLERNRDLGAKRMTLRSLERQAEAREKAITTSNPEYVKIAGELAELKTQAAAKQAQLDALIEGDPELQRLSKAIVEAEATVETDRAALQNFIRDRKKLEWGAK
jgi:chromosome segregation ATPase